MDTHAESLALYRACRSHAEPERTEGLERLGEILYRVAWSRVQADPALHDLAEEAMQDSLAIVWRHLSAGRGPEPATFIAWAITIVVNKVREGVRRLEPSSRSRPTRRVPLSRQVSLDAGAEASEAPLGERLAAADDEMDEALRYEALHGLLAEIATMEALSEASRRVLLLGFIEGLDDGELADLLGTSRANVHVIRCRDLARLRDQPEYMERLRKVMGDG